MYGGNDYRDYLELRHAAVRPPEPYDSIDYEIKDIKRRIERITKELEYLADNGQQYDEVFNSKFSELQDLQYRLSAKEAAKKGQFGAVPPYWW